MVLYGIKLVSMVEELRAAGLGRIALIYADDAAFDGSERQSRQLMKLLLERGGYQGDSLSQQSPFS